MIFSTHAQAIRLTHFYSIRPTTQYIKPILEVARTFAPNNTRKIAPIVSSCLANVHCRKANDIKTQKSGSKGMRRLAYQQCRQVVSGQRPRNLRKQHEKDGISYIWFMAQDNTSYTIKNI